MSSPATAIDGASPARDRAYMAAALALARRGLGLVAPNPAVGCLLVRDARVVGRGWTQPGGRPHAETEALKRAGAAAEGATAYVTLEPCSHHGKTPPCAEALIAAKIARCVVALEDPDDRVAGRGLARLHDAGIAVSQGVMEREAAELNAGYLLCQREGRPLVTLKFATSLDGKIATKSGDSRWISGEASRARAHLIRARYDAILVGSGTAVTDNPRLDVRLPGMGNASPLRVVLDGRLRLPLTHDLVARAGEQPTWLFTRFGNQPARLKAYRDCGVEVIEVPAEHDSRLSILASLKVLGERGLTRVLVEGGGNLAAGLLQCDLVDRLIWFRAALAIGGDGLPALAGFGLDKLAGAPKFERECVEPVGEDLVECYRRRR
ncbi:MAG: bifunctional diaminohydroxyphosphoribosylaminopyrimidine deaminase/5-amino-6-(5-phosphoribosylamino)uracil reductase RibD [Kiloniellales bacterium]